jgi:hypothetical protein
MVGDPNHPFILAHRVVCSHGSWLRDRSRTRRVYGDLGNTYCRSDNTL